MHLIDLHCDTLYKAVTQNISFSDKALECQLIDKRTNSHKLQCYAIWIPDKLNGDEADELFLKAYNKLLNECYDNEITLIDKFKDTAKSFSKYANTAFFTIENGLAINKKLESIEKFAKLGVKMITLTWNDHNCIGGGADTNNSLGLTEFGRKAVAEMDRHKIIIDISHASDRLFYDVSEITSRPFIASHSNSRSITNHRRNLTDEQFKIICDRGGIVGINFHNAFLNNVPDNACMDDILRHTEHFLSLGGENSIAIGSDFDGCVLAKNINGTASIDKICDIFSKNGYNDDLIQKIFYKNALNFFENFDI